MTFDTIDRAPLFWWCCANPLLNCSHVGIPIPGQTEDDRAAFDTTYLSNHWPMPWRTSQRKWKKARVLKLLKSERKHDQETVSRQTNNAIYAEVRWKPALQLMAMMLIGFFKIRFITAAALGCLKTYPKSHWQSLTTLWHPRLINVIDSQSLTTLWLQDSRHWIRCHWQICCKNQEWLSVPIKSLWLQDFTKMPVDFDWVTGCPLDAGSKPTIVLLIRTQNIAKSN